MDKKKRAPESAPWAPKILGTTNLPHFFVTLEWQLISAPYFPSQDLGRFSTTFSLW